MQRYAVVALLAASAAGCVLAAPPPTSVPAVIRTPYAATGPLKIRKVTLASSTVPRYGRLEATVDLSATFANPFDPRDVALDGTVTSPSGRRQQVPGFFYQRYRRELKEGEERLTAEGATEWRLRYAPSEVGAHRLVVILRDRTGSVKCAPLRFTVTSSADPGFVRVSGDDRRYFAFDGGKPYFPIGANVCWAGRRGTFDYDDWLPAYAKAGCNYGRLWLSPHWATFALEQAGKPEEGRGLGQFDLANAWRLDELLNLAQREGLYLMLCIDSYNVLRAGTEFPSWERSPQNAANGGPLRRPEEFWTDPVMAARYEDKLRYLVARYGASTHVLAWEFWNEVDGISAYSAAPVRDWHARMGRTLRAVDPYRHLITTSFSRTEGEPEIDRLPEIDYVQTHHYGTPDPVQTLARAQAQKAAYGKPHYAGEIGADSHGPRASDDPTGLQVHDPLWASIAGGSSGGAMSWWWDNYLAPKQLYPLFTPAAAFVKGIDWPRERFTARTPRLEWQKRPDPLPRSDLVLEGGPVGWSPSPANRPKSVRITPDGAVGDLPLAGILHGVHNHPELHNPVTFHTDVPWPARLEVNVGDVSGYGGAALRIRLDGRVALEKQFADTDAGNATLTRHGGTYGIDVPAGKHEIVVENTGKDWFMAGIHFPGAREQRSPPLLAWANGGRSTVIAWVRPEARTWQRVCALKQPVPSVPASVLFLPGVAPGKWEAELWDTWTGTVLRRQPFQVPQSGLARVALPEIEKDLAVKLRRTGG